jgi:epoxyqueuosine reductase
MAKSQSSKPGSWAAEIIREFIEKSPENTLQNEANEKAFGTPLGVGFSKGNNPLYEDYKEHVGPFYMTPWEVFAITFRDFSVKPGELTVISWILPQTQATKADNRKETFYPSERWARAKIFGEQVNEKLREHLVAALESKGYQAVAPSLTPQFSIRIPRSTGLPLPGRKDTQLSLRGLEHSAFAMA